MSLQKLKEEILIEKSQNSFAREEEKKQSLISLTKNVNLCSNTIIDSENIDFNNKQEPLPRLHDRNIDSTKNFRYMLLKNKKYLIIS